MINTSIAACIALLAPFAGLAQQTPPDTAKTPATAPTGPSSAALDFSGILFANFQYRGDSGVFKSQNRFDLERAYLTFRMPAGDRASIRITADVFQQNNAPNDSFYKGWVIRAKYAYLQYDLVKRASWGANVRAGILHNVVIDHIESFWPRWLSLSPLERAGFFASSDVGIATLWTFPGNWGELYATIVNGPGYTSHETDRFKDYAARISITPLSHARNKVLSTLAMTGWAYNGAIGSSFAAGGAGQLGPVGSALPRTRSGLFAGVRDPRLTAGVEFDRRIDGGETGANTPASPRIELDSAGRLIAGFVMIKPFQLRNPSSRFPLGLVGRWDRFTPNRKLTGHVNTIVTGLTWDLNKKVSVSADYQEQTPHSATAAATKTYFFHLVASF
jgi:hypothetical protein